MRDCCNHAAETREIVRRVHRQKEAVVRQCRMLSSLQLTRIDKNVVYDDREFAKQQADHCVGVRGKVQQELSEALKGKRLMDQELPSRARDAMGIAHYL